jgi:type VI secretion system protein ImpA
MPADNHRLNLSLTDSADAEVNLQPHLTPVKSQVLSRDVAISQMLAIAHFFRQTEPSSPVPFLMERAARWANMTLTEWLEEMLADGGSLRDINNALTGPAQ